MKFSKNIRKLKNRNKTIVKNDGKNLIPVLVIYWNKTGGDMGRLP